MNISLPILNLFLFCHAVTFHHITGKWLIEEIIEVLYVIDL